MFKRHLNPTLVSPSRRRPSTSIVHAGSRLRRHCVTSTWRLVERTVAFGRLSCASIVRKASARVHGTGNYTPYHSVPCIVVYYNSLYIIQVLFYYSKVLSKGQVEGLHFPFFSFSSVTSFLQVIISSKKKSYFSGLMPRVIELYLPNHAFACSQAEELKYHVPLLPVSSGNAAGLQFS